MDTEAYIALGSNLGDRELNLLRAVAEIGRLPESKVTALSSFYETS
ncbi:MAG TPA: 2-amino-4-hydroxy-6-hydroxymethyldihydropteridine diphosphokinase, partial [Geobacter sp.]|nr:2-amino-4-hydroxy-6-hydroxymethyldihydropteridine diphosphokinase [Geobacter sp.]